MALDPRKTKQTVIAIIFFLIVGGLGFWIYRTVNPVKPIPTPPPTANLTPVQVIYAKLFNIQNNDYDFIAKVTNPNTDYGSPTVNYQITFSNSAGVQVGTKTGSFYILPGQTKYVIQTPIKFSEPVALALMTIKSIDWQKLNPVAASGVNLFVRNPNFISVNQQGVFSKVGGSILNNSDFDLNKVDLNIVLLDQDNTPIAVNKTDLMTFLAKTTRGFEVTWFKPFVGQVNRVDVEANTNVFENSNFLRLYGGQEKFKQQY